MSRPPFHLAFPVDDLEKARAFYVDVLGCREGRSSDRWIDFDLHGHQIVAHQTDPNSDLNSDPKSDAVHASARSPAHPEHQNPVDGHDVPVPHFGLVLDLAAFDTVLDRLRRAGLAVEPYVRFAGQPGEQRTVFIRDPAGNALEFKAFRDVDESLFAR